MLQSFHKNINQLNRFHQNSWGRFLRDHVTLNILLKIQLCENMDKLYFKIEYNYLKL